MTKIRNKLYVPLLWISILKEFRTCRTGVLVLLLTLLAASVLIGIEFKGPSRLYVSGEIADKDVIADRDMLVQDAQATEARRRHVMLVQPQVYDLSSEPYTQFHNRITDVFKEINNALPESKEGSVLKQLRSELGTALYDEIFSQLVKSETQNYFVKILLPEIRKKLAGGLVSDTRVARAARSGIIIRNLDTGGEVLLSDSTGLQDVQTFLTEISANLRKNENLDAQMRRAINILLSVSMPASLTLNQEATHSYAQSVAERVEPVFYHIQKGECIVRKGDRVSREQQVKLQTMHRSHGDGIRISFVAGLFIFSSILAVGFFMTPSGRMGKELRTKDLLLISSIIFSMTLCAKLCYFAAIRFDSMEIMYAVTYGFPVAAGVALTTMVFAARRYLTISILLALYVGIVFRGEIEVFLFHFLSSMLVTWLIGNARNRQDIVLSIFPLALFQIIFMCGGLLLASVPLHSLPLLIGAVICSSAISILSLFALSPVLEMAFGYTTRFRLMELMNLEQPLMQQLMVNMPGTYHHSLIVANMVEAGAKAVGANSMLCKVAALYHDIGKISYPMYFIENQFGGPNRHDKLAPSMSALIIISHVKKGCELIERNKIGEEILDIIRQHHGTRVIRYFFQKSVELGECPAEADFSYPGPKPQSKEAAILMLADSVEASSRTLVEPTPARIQTHVDKIVKGIFSEGQLDESELTFKDLNSLSQSFVRILTGIFHQRIAYPSTTRNEKAKNDDSQSIFQHGSGEQRQNSTFSMKTNRIASSSSGGEVQAK